jgi:hypothetical protein
MVPFMSSTVITLAPSIAKISFAHSLRISSSAYDIFTHSFVYPSGPGDLSAFKQLSTELLNSLSVTLPFADVWEKFGGSSADQPVLQADAFLFCLRLRAVFAYVRKHLRCNTETSLA